MTVKNSEPFHVQRVLIRIVPAVIAVLVIALAAVVILNRGSNATAPREKITIGVTPWPASAALYVAHEKGFFRDEGLDATPHLYVSGHLALDAALTGQADLAAAGDTPIARAAVNGKQPAVVATVSKIDQAILVIARKDRGISAPTDLKGRKVGLVAGTTAEFFLHVYLTASLIDPKDVRIVDLPTEKVVDALLNGEVDAVTIWAPHTIVLRERLGDDALILHEPGIYVMTWNIMASQDFIKNHPEAVKRFLRAIFWANSFINDRPEEARAIAARHIGTDSAFYTNEWKDYEFTAVLDQSLIVNLEDQARWMIKKDGSGRKTPNFMGLIYTGGLKSIKPESVNIAGK